MCVCVCVCVVFVLVVLFCFCLFLFLFSVVCYYCYVVSFGCVVTVPRTGRPKGIKMVLRQGHSSVKQIKMVFTSRSQQCKTD